MATHCFDEPFDLLGTGYCLYALSKDCAGESQGVEEFPHKCADPACVTVRYPRRRLLKLTSHPACDAREAIPLDGELRVKPFVAAFDTNFHHRGIHAGDFEWVTPTVVLQGRMSGVVNAGTHRAPAFPPCEPCNAPGTIEGRLCGQVVGPAGHALVGASVMASYLLEFDAGSAVASTVRGTLEGMLIVPCKKG